LAPPSLPHLPERKSFVPALRLVLLFKNPDVLFLTLSFQAKK
jgi:hypothetical protein